MKWLRWQRASTPEHGILDTVSASNVRIYHTLADRAEELEHQISGLSEELRQCRVAMEATSAALTFVGVDPALALERTLSIDAVVESSFSDHLTLALASI